MIKKLTAALTATALVSSPAMAESQWRYTGTSTSGSLYYIRTTDWLAGDSQVRNGRAWVKTDDSRNARVGWSESRALYSIDCVAQTYRLLSGVLYYRNGDSTQLRAGQLEYVVPESNMDVIVSAFCS